MSKAPNAEKGARYLAQLDQALCNGNWPEIQELARKTDKHAPERRCFTLTARAEAQIASASHRPTSTPSNATSSIHGLGDLVPKLKEGIASEKKYIEHSYVARVCLAVIHWLREEWKAALEVLKNVVGHLKAGSDRGTALGWLEVCDAKASFIQATALESSGRFDEARQVYLAAATRVPGSRTPELRRWTERLLARGCVFMRARAESPSIQTLSESLRCFIAWSDFWQRAPSPTSSSASPRDISRRQVWKSYYGLLSSILQRSLMYNPLPSSTSDLLTVPSDDISEDQYASAKLRQRAALKRVGATYESLLLNETQFPKADQTNNEVEVWVEQVVGNWKILCGSEWTDAELGDGGKESVGRGVLDTLYRAATKTFHSTAILRQLFTVHAALGDFDLAMHAFDSYVELVSKGKDRAEKTGTHDLGFDSDDVAVLTAAEAVRILCRYGDREQGEKAIEVCKTIRKWLSQGRPTTSGEAAVNEDNRQADGVRRSSLLTESSLQPNTLAAAWRALGTSQANWARMTYETGSRSALRAEAVEYLRRAQTYNSDSITTAYALALVLAESRDVAAAMQVIKRAISSSNLADIDENEGDDYSKERQLVPVWHLLALCLTAKDDYEQAAKICEAAFEQFGDSMVLFGDGSARKSVELEKKVPRSSRGLVDQMESFEKEDFLKIRMSQMAFVELMEGAETAVDTSNELLSLYARLFGNPEVSKVTTKPPSTAASTTPSKAGGTLRSIAGSMRPKSARHSAEKDAQRRLMTTSSPDGRPSTVSGEKHGSPNDQNIGVPIAITVTNEDGVPTEKPHHHKHLPFKIRGHSGDSREMKGLKSTRSAGNLKEKSVPAPVPEEKPLPPTPKETVPVDHSAEKDQPVIRPAVTNRMLNETPASPEQPLKEIEHNAPHDQWPPPPGHQDQPPRQDIRLPAPHPASASAPEPQFPSAQDRQQKIGLLVAVWLFIAGLYLRANLLDDASGSINEASKLIESFEAEVGAEDSSARRFFNKGWGGGKSVDELWADVWAAKGDLASARELPFEAMAHYEQALSHWPDHPEGIIGVSNILMDIFEEKIPAEEPRPPLQPLPSASGSTTNTSTIPRPALASKPSTSPKATDEPTSKNKTSDPTPAELNRLAARDRAYMLLSNLTRLGSGWDSSEAWYTLARAYELSKQVGKAKQALWWVVELEENKPMRPWCEVSGGGFTL